MTNNNNKYRFLFAGGGTGGHIFPAIAVAQKIKSIKPEADILFVGTKNKIESKVVPQSGYKFKSIWVSGFSRKLTFKNLLFPFKLIISVFQSIVINMKFKPVVAIGSGGYVSGPAIFGADIMGSKIILLEQNNYPGVTTRLLERYADEIHLCFKGAEKYFNDNKKLKVTGNPIRDDLIRIDKVKTLKEYGLSSDKKILLVLGGSLGAGSINESVASNIENLKEKDIQIIWQTGSYDFEKYKKYSSDSVKIFSFIDKINSAYSTCDLLIARAGGITISELLVLGIPSILVPSPNVAGNHQYHNAKYLAEENAAILLHDSDLTEGLWNQIESTIFDELKLNELSKNALLLAKPNAAKDIAESAIKFVEQS